MKAGCRPSNRRDNASELVTFPITGTGQVP